MNLPTIKSEAYDNEFVAGDIEELLRWCNLQAAFYKKIEATAHIYRNEHIFSDIRRLITEAISLEDVAEELKVFAEQPEADFEDLLTELHQVSDRLFNEFGLPPADSEIGLQLSAHIDVDPNTGFPALFSLSEKATQTNHHFQLFTPALWRGIGIGASLALQRTQRRKPQRYAKAVRDWVSSAQSDLARTRTRAELTIRDLRDNVSDLKRKAADFDAQHTARLVGTTKSFVDLLSDTNKEIAEFKTFVKSEIALKAPVTYWETKAAEHENKAFFFGISSFILMFVCGVGAFQSLNFVKEIVGTGDKTNYAGIAVVAVLVTLTFWVIRLVVRLFLSQQHLGADARERTAMVKTYLALKEAGVAPKDGDLTPVLVALFRTSSDGIVKDEAMPPVLAEILTRTKN